MASVRLGLRPYMAADAPAYLRMWRENRVHLREFMPDEVGPIDSSEEMEAHIRWMAEEREARRLFIFGAWERESGDYVGEVYLGNADWTVPCIEIGYFLREDRTGQGFASEAVQELIAFARGHLQVSRVELRVAADNGPSIAVAERCGFALEGRQRQRQRKKDGALVDRLLYGLVFPASNRGTP